MSDKMMLKWPKILFAILFCVIFKHVLIYSLSRAISGSFGDFKVMPDRYPLSEHRAHKKPYGYNLLKAVSLGARNVW